MKEKASLSKQILAVCDKLPDLCVSFLLESSTSMSNATRLAYAHELDYFFSYLIDKNPLFCDKEASSITKEEIGQIVPADISRYLTICKTNGLKDKTIARKRAAVSSFFSYLTKNKYIDYNPAQAAEKVKVSKSDEVIHLDIEEQVDFLNAIDDGTGLTGKAVKHHERYRLRDLALITFLLDTGMRVSELNACDIKDLDFERCSVLIIRKGGNKQTIYYSDEAKELLIEYINSRKAKHPDLTADAPLFVTDTESRLSIRAIQVLVKKYAGAALPGKGNITPHKMRSSFAMAYYEETHDILALQRELGHKNLAATNIYAKATDKKLQQNRSVLGNKRDSIRKDN